MAVLMRSRILPPRTFLLRSIVVDRWLLDAFAAQVEIKKLGVCEDRQVVVQVVVFVLLGGGVVCWLDGIQICNVLGYIWCSATIEAGHGCV